MDQTRRAAASVGAPSTAKTTEYVTQDQCTFEGMALATSGTAQKQPEQSTEFPPDHPMWNGCPLVFAHDTGKQFVFKCGFCRSKHFHSRVEGHRSAHCHRPNSPYKRTGYMVLLISEASEWSSLASEIIQQMGGPAPESSAGAGNQ